MSVADPTFIQVHIDIPIAQHQELIKKAQAAGYNKLEQYIISLGNPAPALSVPIEEASTETPAVVKKK